MFGEPLDAVFCLQERIYPMQRMPIILPFLAGILTLSGKKTGHLCVPSGSDARCTQEAAQPRLIHARGRRFAPHACVAVLDPLVPSEMSNGYIVFVSDAEAYCVAVERLPTIYRHVVLPYSCPCHLLQPRYTFTA